MAQEAETLTGPEQAESGSRPALFITHELLPFQATGGMAVLSRDLPEALIRKGWPHCYLLPYVSGVSAVAPEHLRKPLLTGSVQVDDTDFEYQVYRIARPAAQGDVFLVAQDELFNNRLYDDHFRVERNLLVAAAACALLGQHRPDIRIVHALDQLSALSLAWIRAMTGDRFGLVFNILSAEYDFPLGEMLKQRRFAGREALTHVFGRALTGDSAIELGLRSADRTVTSSPAYGEDMMARYGSASGLADYPIIGIAQGIDTAVWDPLAQGRLFRPVRYESITHDKQANRRLLSAMLASHPRFSRTIPAEPGLEPATCGTTLLSFVGRFCRAKGRAALYHLIDRLETLPGVELLLMIPGGSVTEVDLEKLRARTESVDRLTVIACYDQALAELVFAASDFIVMPSEQEPGGLCQKMAMRFGALPVVTPAGGLKSSVNDLFAAPDTGNGFVSNTIDPESYFERLAQVLALPPDSDLLARGRTNAMATDVSWVPTIAGYEAIYRDLSRLRT